MTLDVLKECPVAPAGTIEIVKFTPTPLTGLPFVSTTVTVNGCPRVVLTLPLCPLPDVVSNDAAAPAVALLVNIIGLPVNPTELAVT
jgi:hypothetical protein